MSELGVGGQHPVDHPAFGSGGVDALLWPVAAHKRAESPIAPRSQPACPPT